MAASDGVEIPYDELNRLSSSLKQIATEFQEAGSRSDQIIDAVGTPLGRSGLRSQVDRFEGRWDDKRETLRQKVEELVEHVDAVGTEWVAWDEQASIDLTLDPGPSTKESGR